VILVGDAAGVDPVVGEGISFALGYGQVAAYALQDAFARQDFSFRDYRRRLLRHRTGRYLRRRYWGARLLYGLRNRLALQLVWRLVGPLASAYFIDWTWNQKD
jgi:flavin-dependent dehydrogenase